MKYFIDTNYLLRLLLRDDEKQFQIVYDLFKKAITKEIALFSSHLVFFEIFWVLSSFYKEDKEQVIVYLRKILEIDQLHFPQKSLLTGTIDLYEESRIDIEDCYNILFAHLEESDVFGSFDRTAIKLYNKI
ncbi:MAG: PIN domain-containing protein [bacterium]|nr:PIN domain-containing protein [bacterium]